MYAITFIVRRIIDLIQIAMIDNAFFNILPFVRSFIGQLIS